MPPDFYLFYNGLHLVVCAFFMFFYALFVPYLCLICTFCAELKQAQGYVCPALVYLSF